MKNYELTTCLKIKRNKTKNHFAIYLIIVVFSFMLFSCLNKNDTLRNETIVDNKNAIDTVITELIINGDNIWVRSAPKTGEVVAKLNTGDTCQIITKSEKDQIKCMVDFWYEIQIDDTIGWIFGSQTNIALNGNPIVMEYVDVLKYYFKENNNLNNLIHQSIGYYFADNPGAACFAIKTFETTHIEFLQENIYIFKDEIPQGEGFLNISYPEIKDGIYFNEININGLPNIQDQMGGTYRKYALPSNFDFQKLYVNKVIINEGYCCTFYVALIDCQWYLLYFDYCKPGMA